MLHGGEGAPRDFDAGLAWMRKSAEGGYGPAQAFLGIAYTLGQGMAIDRKLGEYWSRKGAAQGVELANFTLAHALRKHPQQPGRAGACAALAEILCRKWLHPRLQ
jgi:TPR repeat protein